MKKAALLFTFAITGTFVYSQTTWYVKPIATGTGDGSSWTNAFGDLQEAINASSSSPGDTIFVAKGTYIPNRRADDVGVITPNDRDNAFVLKNNVKIYGGFDPDNGIDDLSDNRIFGESGSILSSDFNGNDIINGFGNGLSITNNGENAHHVVVSVGPVGTALLNGFTITAGNANGTGNLGVNGYMLAKNSGSILLWGSSPAIEKCFIVGNSGGNGATIVGLSCSTVISNCSFYRNNGGTSIFIASSSPFQIKNSIFWGNRAPALISGGNSALSLSNGVITENSCQNIISSTSASLSINNSILWNNNVNLQVIYTFSGAPPVITNSIVQGGYAGTGNMDDNPSFENPSDPDGADNIFGTADDGLRLRSCSRAINKGDNSYLGSVTKDIIGNPRIADGTVDLGPYEYQASPVFDGSIYTVTACSPYTWIDGNVYTTDNNTAVDTLTNVAGCDSIVTLNLTILPTPAAPTVTPASIDINPGQYVSFSATGNGGTLNWYESGNSVGTGTTFVSPVIIAGKIYEVTETESGCESPRTPVVVGIRSSPTFEGRNAN